LLELSHGLARINRNLNARNAPIPFQPAPSFARIAAISFWFSSNVRAARKTSHQRQNFVLAAVTRLRKNPQQDHAQIAEM
jgi:hypothetical protein